MNVFDSVADNYHSSVSDPIKRWFGGGDLYFAIRKVEILFRHIELQCGCPEQCVWLDLGCGVGDMLRAGGGRALMAIGCDTSAEMISRCADLVVRRQLSEERIPMSDGQCDVISMACVLHHVTGEQRHKLFKEAFRVLREGGICVCFEHNPLNPITQMIVRRCLLDRGVRLLRPGEVVRSGELARLRAKTLEYYLFFPQQLQAYGSDFLEKCIRWLPLGGQYAVIFKK